MRKSLVGGLFFTLLASSFVFSSAHADDKKIRVGFNPGPYKEQFKKGIEPYLNKHGYTVEYKDFTDGVQVNDAVSRGNIEANIMQHPVYLQSVNERLGIDNIGIVQVPTPPMGLYSEKIKILETPQPGTVVSIPNQASNAYRAALVLQGIGWIKIRPDSDPATFSQRFVSENPYKIVLKELDNAQQVRSLPDVDFGLIQGNFAVSSGMKLDSALTLEKPTNQFVNVVTIASKNKDADFAKALVDAYHSDEFKNYIHSHPQYAGYMLPDYFK